MLMFISNNTFMLSSMKSTFTQLTTGLLLVLCISFGNAQNISFSDANFKQALLANGVDANNDKEISIAEANAFTRPINLLNKQITDITGIEHFTQITGLELSFNKLTSVDVSKNIALQRLSCGSNQIASLNVSKNVNLTELLCQNNKLTSLDVSKNIQLRDLLCFQNMLTTIDVSKNTKLEDLYCKSNQITSLNVSKNLALQNLDFDNNKVNSIDVSLNTQLTLLKCNANGITSLNLSKNNMLTTLSCSFNNITTLSLSNLTALEKLYCDNTGLSNLNVSNSPSLKDLSFKETQISAIDLSNNTALEKLELSNSPVKSLSLTANTKLKELYISNSGIRTLDLSMNTNLQRIFSFDSQLEALDLSNSPKMTTLDCRRSNNLKKLNLANGKTANLSRLFASENPSLTCIQVDANFTKPSSWLVDTQTSINTSCFTVSTEELLDNQVRIFPNPVSNTLNIQVDDVDQYEVKLFNVLGQELISTRQNQMDVSSLSGGHYFIQIADEYGNVLKSKPVVIE